MSSHDSQNFPPLEEINMPEFTAEMRDKYTILVPNMLPVHWKMMQKVFQVNGYKVDVLNNQGPHIAQLGLQYVHNDTCYPALLVIGQFIDALKSGKWDTHKVALMITQTGGGCRASNYIHLLRKALKKAGYDYIPVISLNLSGLEKTEGFSLTLPLIRQLLATLAYGDMMTLLANQIRPYENNKGEADVLTDKWVEELSQQFGSKKGLALGDIKENYQKIAEEYSRIPVTKTEKKKVGVVGEIYIKYASLGNNQLEEFLASQDCEVMVPGILAFILFKTDNRLEDIRLYGGNKIKYLVIKMLFDYIQKIETSMLEALKPYPQFIAPSTYKELKEYVQPFVGYGNKMGEGWLLTAEMIELVNHGFSNIICAQPFGCLPNHIVGKGMIRKIRETYPQANIVPIDYDPSATKANQENRIKLMLSLADE